MKGINEQPFIGEIGEKIHSSISEEAWSLWLKQQVNIINEYELDLSILEHRKIILELLEKFLFFA